MGTNTSIRLPSSPAPAALPPSPWVKIPEAAAALQCSVATVNRMIADGRLPSTKVGRLRRIPRHAVQTFAAPTVGEAAG